MKSYNIKTQIELKKSKEFQPADLRPELKRKLEWLMKTRGELASKVIHEWIQSDPPDPIKEYIEI